MSNGLRSPASMETWLRMLDQVQESLDRALRDVEAHERWLAESEAEAGGPSPEVGRRCLEVIDERLRGLAGHQEASGRLAAGVTDLLDDDERAARAWADRAAAARRRLASLAPAGV